jgi:hypothetical protein
VISYAVIVRIGPYEFVKPFMDEQSALDCFDSIAVNPDGEITNGTMTMCSDALVDVVTVRRYNDAIDRMSDHEKRLPPASA